MFGRAGVGGAVGMPKRGEADLIPRGLGYNIRLIVPLPRLPEGEEEQEEEGEDEEEVACIIFPLTTACTSPVQFGVRSRGATFLPCTPSPLSRFRPRSTTIPSDAL
eukprot:9481530-Pyramimonas_sp.AAC.1